MAEAGSDQGVDQHVRTYLVDKLKLMHQRLLRERGAEGADSPPSQSADTTGLLEHLPFAVFTMDLEGRFLYANRAAEQLTGYSRDELSGKPYYETDLLRFRDLIKVAALFTLTRGEQRDNPFRLAYRSKDGAQGKLEATVYLVPRGNGQQILCVAREAPARLFAAPPTEEVPTPEARLDRAVVPISLCGDCKKVEDIDGDWIPLEYFLYKRLELEFMHETCPDCAERRARGRTR
jgi:PAS domain S-box-containing protein